MIIESPAEKSGFFVFVACLAVSLARIVFIKR